MYNTKGASTDGERRELKIVIRFTVDTHEQDLIRGKKEIDTQNTVREVTGDHRPHQELSRECVCRHRDRPRDHREIEDVRHHRGKYDLLPGHSGAKRYDIM